MPQAFGLDPDNFATSVIRNPRKGKKTSANITNRFTVTGTSMSESWSTLLSSAKLVKEVSSVGSRSVTYYYWLELTFKVSVPEDTEPGIYSEVVRVKAKDGEERPVPMNFTLMNYNASSD